MPRMHGSSGGRMNALQPPHVDDADKPLRRAVAMACRGRMIERMRRSLADSPRVSEMIASAVAVNQA